MGTDWGFYKNSGTPEGVRFAQEGSLCSDIVSGRVYRKSTSSLSNIGWIELGDGKSPSQSVAFMGTITTRIDNILGDGINYPLTGYGERYDIGNNFDPTTGVFTVPSNGVYFFSGLVSIIDIQSNHTLGNISFRLTGSLSGNITGQAYNPTNMAQANSHLVVSSPYQFSLRAGDTVGLGTNVSGGSKVISLLRAYFAGFKIF